MSLFHEPIGFVFPLILDITIGANEIATGVLHGVLQQVRLQRNQENEYETINLAEHRIETHNYTYLYEWRIIN